MNLLEPAMSRGQVVGEAGGARSEAVHVSQPFIDLGRDKDPRRRDHASWERVNVVLAKVAWTLESRCLCVRLDVPDRRHGHPVNLTDLGESQNSVGCPRPGLDGLAVHPFGVGLSPTARPSARRASTCRRTSVLPSMAVE